MASVSPEASTVRVAMVPSALKVAVTFTSDSRPLAAAVLVSAAGAAVSSSAGNMLFTALITALEVKVAPVTTSAPSKGPALPMNCARKASSVQGLAMASVSPEASTTRVAMVPSALKVAVTFTSDSRPFAEAVLVSAAGAAASSSAGNMLFTALITALEVKVAPVTTSAPSKGPALPMNWDRKASSVQGLAMASVSPEASTTRVAMVPSALKVAVTFTSDSRPLAEAVFSVATGASSVPVDIS